MIKSELIEMIAKDAGIPIAKAKISGVGLYANIGAESETRHFITSDCNYSISSTNNTVSSGDGTGRFDVSTSSTSCEWSAEANAAWVTITSESSGIGDGAVT